MRKAAVDGSPCISKNVACDGAETAVLRSNLFILQIFSARARAWTRPIGVGPYTPTTFTNFESPEQIYLVDCSLIAPKQHSFSSIQHGLETQSHAHILK